MLDSVLDMAIARGQRDASRDRIKYLEAEVERLKARECFVVFDYDHVTYAGYDRKEAEKHLKGSNKAEKWQGGKRIRE